MTEQEQIRAIAELANDHDAIVIQPDGSVNFVLEGAVVGHMDNPLKSRDVIVPVIEMAVEPWDMEHFVSVLTSQVLAPHWKGIGKNPELFTHLGWSYSCLMATPAQLCEALLKSCDKWKD